MISLITAHSLNYVIGKNNTLPWNYSEDLQHFKKLTTGKTILMGRKTFDSIGRALPKRKNIVLTRDKSWSADNVEVIHSFHQILKTYEDIDEELMIIGGQQIYELFLPYAHKLYITIIKKEVEGDTYFPEYKDFFKEDTREVHHEFDFTTRIKKHIT